MDEQEYRARREKRKKKAAAGAVLKSVIAVILLLPLLFLTFWVGSRLLFPEGTDVEGLDKGISHKAGKLVRRVTVTNPAGRELELQKFNENDRKWVTKASYPMGHGEKQKVKVRFPKAWTKSTYSKWRVYVGRSFGSKKYVGDSFKIVCKNRGNIRFKAAAAVVYSIDDDTVLYDVHMNKKLANASTTKMMTAILAFENSSNEEVVTVSRRASITPWAYFPLKKGSQFRMGDLKRAMLIGSSNDAATAIAEHIGGTYENFVDRMNERAKELGCKRTHFVTPSGLDANGHHSTAYDLAMINKKAIEFGEYNEIVKMRKFHFNSLNRKKKGYDVKTTNELLKEHLKGYMGGKTGTTAQAGNCLSSAYRWKGKTYILVVLDAGDRFKATKLLMKYVRKYA